MNLFKIPSYLEYPNGQTPQSKQIEIVGTKQELWHNGLIKICQVIVHWKPGRKWEKGGVKI